MNTRKPPFKGQRPSPNTKPAASKPSKHYWHRRCYPWYDYDYDWNDYDYDWDYYSHRRSKAPMADWEEGSDDAVMMAYQQGFKDGWVAAMEYAYYGEGNTNPEPVVPPPAPPTQITPPEKPTE